MARRAHKALRNRMAAAGMTAPRRYVVLYAKRTIPLFRSLREAWEGDNGRRHAETTGLILGQLAALPTDAVELLEPLGAFMQRKGPQGVEGLFLSCLSVAQVLDRRSFNRAINIADALDVGASSPIKNGLGIYFADLGGFARGGAGGHANPALLLTGFKDNVRGSLFAGGVIGSAGSGPGTFGQEVRGALQDGRMTSRLGNTYGLLVSCEEAVRAGGTIVGANVGSWAGAVAGFAAGGPVGAVAVGATGLLAGGVAGGEIASNFAPWICGGETVEVPPASPGPTFPDDSAPDGEGDVEDSGGTCEPGDEHASCPHPDQVDGSSSVFGAILQIGASNAGKPSPFVTLVNPGSAQPGEGTRIITADLGRPLANPHLINPNPEGSSQGEGPSVPSSVIRTNPLGLGTLTNPGSGAEGDGVVRTGTTHR